MMTRSKAKENGPIKRRRLERNPLLMNTILEKIFSFLDVDSIKLARQVNKFWSVEGAKILISKCYVKIPYQLKERTKKNNADIVNKFKAFLSYKSSQTIMIPNIKILPGEFQLWKSLGVLGPQVKSIKLDTYDVSYSEHYKTELTNNLLDLLPNLHYLCLKKVDYLTIKTHIIRVLTAVMSKAERAKNLLVISTLDLQPEKLEDLWIMEKFADCSNIMIEELDFGIFSSCFFRRIPDFEARVIRIVNKLLATSQNTMTSFKMSHCEIFLALLDFPCMTTLNHISLNFDKHTTNRLLCFEFPPSFRFSEKVPKLEGILVHRRTWLGQNGDSAAFFANLFENTGTAPSVRRLECFVGLWDFAADFLIQIFPNMEEFKTYQYGCSQRLFQSLWRYGEKLKKLDIKIDVDVQFGQLTDLDSIFTGFLPETVEMLKSHPKLTLDAVDNEVEKLRVNPSILNLKELQSLRLCIDRITYGATIDLPKGMLAIAGEFAFKLLSKETKIVIQVGDFAKKPTKDVMASLDEVSTLPNVTVLP